MEHPSLEPLFEPSILGWAREKSGMSLEIVASKFATGFADVSPDLIRKWENGLDQPTPSHVKKLAEIYKRPLAVFLLAKHPDENPLPPDRRTIWSKMDTMLSPEALLVIRRARRVQELATDLDEELGVSRSFRYKKHNISENPITLAAQMRDSLELSATDHAKFRTYSDYFDFLRQKIESSGVITLKTGGHNSFPTEDARALSFTDRQPYVILINNKDTEGAKNFSLLHEFAHVLLREAGICNNFSSFVGDKGKKIDTLEVFCNQFAADFLVPERAFLANQILRGRSGLDLKDIELIVKPLALEFKVSRFVILRRFLTFGLIGTGTYRTKSKEWEAEKLPTRSGGRTVPSKLAISNNGIAFSSLVLDAYKQEKLSHSAASDYLGIKAKYLRAVEDRLHAYGR